MGGVHLPTSLGPRMGDGLGENVGGGGSGGTEQRGRRHLNKRARGREAHRVGRGGGGHLRALSRPPRLPALPGCHKQSS